MVVKLNIGDKVYHPCSIDIVEHEINGIKTFETKDEKIVRYIAKATHNVGACGRVEICLEVDKQNKIRFVGLANDYDDEDESYCNHLGDFVEGLYYTSLNQARKDFYEIHRIDAYNDMRNKERLYEDAKKRYEKLCLLLEELKKETI